jgi:TatD DNase family protein
MIDSHAHIYLEQFDTDREDMIVRAAEAGVSRIYMPNIDHTSIDAMLETEQKHKGMCIPMMGLHPCSVQKGFEKELYIVEQWLSTRKWSAVGEIGLDLYWDKSTLDMQIEALKVQIGWAKKYEIPIVLHCRDAFQELFRVLEEVGTNGLNGVFHCFTGERDDLQRINEFEFYIGLGGVITFKKENFSAMTDIVKYDRILLETDSPYLAPVPNRGKRNEPSYLAHISERLSEMLDISPEELDQLTTNNTLDFFAETDV